MTVLIPPCPEEGDLVEEAIDQILTQYRESPYLISVLRMSIEKIEEAAIKVCSIPSFFDLDTAIGDQLTLLGKRLGWPRCHCVCDIQPVFGFYCGAVYSYIPIVGFCDDNSTWIGCNPIGIGEICINDDDRYRGYLKARRYQAMGLYDIQSLHNALQHLWGPTAWVADSRVGYVVIAPGRELNDNELSQLPLVGRVLPIAPGVAIKVHLGTESIFGFGEGWGGFCDSEPSEIYEPIVFEPSSGTVGEFAIGQGTKVQTGPQDLSSDSHWLCPLDVHPYDCAV